MFSCRAIPVYNSYAHTSAFRVSSIQYSKAAGLPSSSIGSGGGETVSRIRTRAKPDTWAMDHVQFRARFKLGDHSVRNALMSESDIGFQFGICGGTTLPVPVSIQTGECHVSGPWGRGSFGLRKMRKETSLNRPNVKTTGSARLSESIPHKASRAMRTASPSEMVFL